MVEPSTLHDADYVLRQTSRTFFIPISYLPPPLKETVSAAYLCCRAIDEIEDHPTLETKIKVTLLTGVARQLQSSNAHQFTSGIARQLAPYTNMLPEVTLRLSDWLLQPPSTIAPRIWDVTATLANRMANWTIQDWKINDQQDLEDYTFCVAGSVGLLLSDLWAWHANVQTDRAQAVAFGKGLQVVNILRNRAEDLSRGVDFFPQGWQAQDMAAFARSNLVEADKYVDSLPPGKIASACRLPLVFAYETVAAIENGTAKLSRQRIEQLLIEHGFTQ